MKKLFCGLTVLAMFFTGCSVHGETEKNSGEATAEVAISETAPLKIETSVSETANAETMPSKAKGIKGDRIIRTGTRLDTAEVDNMGPLIDGKVITFKNVGEPYTTFSYFSNQRNSTVKLSFCEQEIGYMNCTTGEKVTLTRIKPITWVTSHAYTYSDDTYVYLYYKKLPDEKLPQSMDEQEYENCTKDIPYTLLRINVKTNELTEYEMEFTDFSCGVFVVGVNSLLITYYDEGTVSNIRCMNLNDGEVREFYTRPEGLFYEHPDGIKTAYDEIDLVGVFEDKVYFTYTNLIETNEYAVGFKVYDTNMKLLNQTEVAIRSYPYIRAVVIDDKEIYCSVYDSVGVENDLTEKVFKVTSTNNGYRSVPYNGTIDMSLGNSKLSFYQTADLSQLTAATPSSQKESEINLKINIDGFQYADNHGDEAAEGNYAINSNRGDVIVASAEKNMGKTVYYYIPKEEILRAVYDE